MIPVQPGEAGAVIVADRSDIGEATRYPRTTALRRLANIAADGRVALLAEVRHRSSWSADDP